MLARSLADVPPALLVPIPLRAGHDRLDHLALRAIAEAASRIRHGLVAACVGDAGPLHVQEEPPRRRRDRSGGGPRAPRIGPRATRILEFSPYGYDERQYCSPGFDLAVGSLTRTPHGRYPEYHTSADDLSFVRARGSRRFARGRTCRCSAVLEGNGGTVNTSPKGEPQLGRRGLYRAIGGYPNPGELQMAMLWVLNLSDGGPTLLDIAERSGLAFATLRAAADRLLEKGLLIPASDRETLQ